MVQPPLMSLTWLNGLLIPTSSLPRQNTGYFGIIVEISVGQYWFFSIQMTVEKVNNRFYVQIIYFISWFIFDVLGWPCKRFWLLDLRVWFLSKTISHQVRDFPYLECCFWIIGNRVGKVPKFMDYSSEWVIRGLYNPRYFKIIPIHKMKLFGENIFVPKIIKPGMK